MRSCSAASSSPGRTDTSRCARTGPVLAQRTVPVEPGDDEASLHERIKIVERQLLVDTVAQLAAAEARESLR